MNKKFINELKAGEAIISLFAVRKKQIKSYNGNSFLVLELGDKTGRTEAVLWENFQQVNEEIQPGDVVKVKGTVGTYREEIQIKLEKIRKAQQSEFDPADFLEHSEKNSEELFQRLLAKAETIQNHYLNQVVKSCFLDQSLSTKLHQAPAGKMWHHAYLGGLLEHTLSVAEICEAAAKQYPFVDRDLLIAGALLHDIGKAQAYCWTTLIDYSDIGRLEGHIVIGERIVREKIQQVPDFPEELKMQLSHLILSHHGSLENSSPIVPMTLEAIVLYYADEMDSKAAAFSGIIRKEGKEGKRWSNWVHLIGRFIYFGDKPSGEKEPEE